MLGELYPDGDEGEDKEFPALKLSSFTYEWLRASIKILQEHKEKPGVEKTISNLEVLLQQKQIPAFKAVRLGAYAARYASVLR